MRGLRWCLMLALIAVTQMAQAIGSERFLESLSTANRNDRLVVTIHFIQQLQYLSHTPTSHGDQVTIRFRSPGPAVVGELLIDALGEGLRSLPPPPNQAPQILSIDARGNLDTDPAVVIAFRQALDFEIRPGQNTRSIDILFEPGATAAAAPATSGNPEEQRLPDQFRQARGAIQAGQYQRAMAIYDRIIAAGVEPYRREAIIALGMARAKRGQSAQAIAQFERYLEEYPDEPETGRIERYLEAVIEGEGDSLASADGGPDPASQWQFFGTFDQFYLLDRGDIGDQGSKTYRSSLLSSANVSWRGKAGSLDVSGRFSGSYDHSFLSERDSPTRVSYLYLDLAGSEGRHEARIGRQRLPSSGVLGYFDGLHYQFHIDEKRDLRYVGGAPMSSTSDGVDTDRFFNGLAMDFHAADDSWLLSLYGLNQTFDGDTDRRALGAEARYFGESVTAYSLLDYDIYFDKLNIFHLFSNWHVQPGTVASLTLDYRRTPGLSRSNALLGQAFEDFDDLYPELSDSDLKRLALDNSLVYRSVYVSLTQQINERWQALLDGGIYRLSDDGSGSDDAPDLDSDDWYLYTQVVGNSLFKPGDMYSAGLRYTDGERTNVASLLLRARIPAKNRWQATPRLRVDYRDRDDDADQWAFVPSLFATYRLTKRTSLELDLGLEFTRTEQTQNDADLDEDFYYLSVGYRHDF